MSPIDRVGVRGEVCRDMEQKVLPPATPDGHEVGRVHKIVDSDLSQRRLVVMTARAFVRTPIIGFGRLCLPTMVELDTNTSVGISPHRGSLEKAPSPEESKAA